MFRFDAIWHGDEPYPGRIPVLVSFDDGYRDNLTRAAPILAQRGVPCVLFTVASLLDGEALWYDVVADVVGHGREAELGTLLPEANRPGTCDAVGWVAAVNSLRGAAAIRAIDALRTEGRRLGHEGRYLSVEDLEDWCKAGFHVGAHTNTHPRLAALDIEQARVEIAASQKALADRLGRPVVHFAYPFGCQGDFSPEHAALLEASGLRLAFTTVPGRNRPGADPFAVHRRCVSGGQFQVGDDVCSETLFLAYLMGWAAPRRGRLAARVGSRASA